MNHSNPGKTYSCAAVDGILRLLLYSDIRYRLQEIRAQNLSR